MDPYVGLKAQPTPPSSLAATAAADGNVVAPHDSSTPSTHNDHDNAADQAVAKSEEDDYAYALSLAEDLSVEREMGAALQEVLCNLAEASKTRTRSKDDDESSASAGTGGDATRLSPVGPLNETPAAAVIPARAAVVVVEEETIAPATNEKRSKKKGQGTAATSGNGSTNSSTSSSDKSSNPSSSASNGTSDSAAAASRQGSVVVEVCVCVTSSLPILGFLCALQSCDV